MSNDDLQDYYDQEKKYYKGMKIANELGKDYSDYIATKKIRRHTIIIYVLIVALAFLCFFGIYKGVL